MATDAAAAITSMRSRVSIYAGIIGGIMLSCLLIVVAVELAYGMPSRWLSRPSGQSHFAATLVLAIAFALLRRGGLVKEVATDSALSEANLHTPALRSTCRPRPSRPRRASGPQ